MNERMGQRGQVLPFIGICLMVLMGVGAIAVDITYVDYQQMRMQSAADAAAVAGAQQLITHGCPDQADAKTAAQNDSVIDNFVPSASVLVQVDNPPTITDGPYKGDNCAVYVNIKVPQTTTWFLKLFNAPSGIPVSVDAVAEMQTTNPSCIYLMKPGVISSFNGAIINAPSCGILVNDTASFSSATVKAQSVGIAGAVPASAGSFPDAAPTPMVQSQDPCPEIAGCAGIVASPPAVSGCTAGSLPTGGTLSPGCYSSLSVSGAVTLSPGTYVLNGTSTFTGATLSGTGVTFYVTASGSANFSGVLAGSSLSPPSSGSYSNVLYYQVPSNTINPQFTGGLTNISGLIYAPGATVTYCCTTGNVILVFGAVTFSSAVGAGNSGNTVTIPSSLNIVRRVVIVE